MGLAYAYDSTDEAHMVVHDNDLFKDGWEHEKLAPVRKRISESENDLNFMFAYLIFLIQFSFMGYMFYEY